MSMPTTILPFKEVEQDEDVKDARAEVHKVMRKLSCSDRMTWLISAKKNLDEVGHTSGEYLEAVSTAIEFEYHRLCSDIPEVSCFPEKERTDDDSSAV